MCPVTVGAAAVGTGGVVGPEVVVGPELVVGPERGPRQAAWLPPPPSEFFLTGHQCSAEEMKLQEPVNELKLD